MKIGTTLAAFALMLAAAGCAGGTEDCAEYNKKICEKINACYGVSEDFSQCLGQLNAQSQYLTDEQCKTEWEYVDSTPCGQFAGN